MQIDIRGKVNEKKLAYSCTLLPLFEAIINSIHAIEEEQPTHGKIEISLIRSSQQQLKLQDKESSVPIIDMIISDNGIGFNEQNFESFNLAHSTYKEKKGGKGIGRFIWLRAFNKVEIESTYSKNGNKYFRKFNFEMTRNGIEKHTNEPINGDVERSTVVRLKGLRTEYQKWCNTDAEEIAMRIIEHCFIYFLNPNCPIISIKDDGNIITVNKLFQVYTKGGHVTTKQFSIRDENFEIHLIKLYSDKIDNKIHFIANTREVQCEKLSNIIPELDSFIADSQGDQFSISAYISGDYLDKNVSEERTLIHFGKQSDVELLFPDLILIEDIYNMVGEIIKDEYSEYIDILSSERYQKVQKFVQDHPRYRQLLKYKKEEVRKVPSNLNDEKMEIELFKIQQRLDFEIKTDAHEILKLIDNIEDKEQFEDRYSELYKKIIEVGNSKLSEYILHRKLVLELLEKHIKKTKVDKFYKEDLIHRLIFPLNKISDEIGYEDHNLWVIDERLSYHKYLASDIKLKNIDPLDSKSEDRPDIIILNKPFAFTNDNKPYSSIVLIEFKRPMREDYSDQENPISQIIKYARQITENEIYDKNGRTFDLKPNTPIYAYIICDLTNNLRKFANDGGFKALPDNNGFFNFNANYSLYVEILSFDKLIEDSKQRNRILFDKLNLPAI